jgi:hypothetical protein
MHLDLTTFKKLSNLTPPSPGDPCENIPVAIVANNLGIKQLKYVGIKDKL